MEPAKVGVADGVKLVKSVYNWHFVRGACLPQAVLQFALHRVDGVPAELKIGVARGENLLEAHAWVEEPGAEHARDDDPNAAFAPLLMRRFFPAS
jgi:hypothetical protein